MHAMFAMAPLSTSLFRSRHGNREQEVVSVAASVDRRRSDICRRAASREPHRQRAVWRLVDRRTARVCLPPAQGSGRRDSGGRRFRRVGSAARAAAPGPSTARRIQASAAGGSLPPAGPGLVTQSLRAQAGESESEARSSFKLSSMPGPRHPSAPSAFAPRHPRITLWLLRLQVSEGAAPSIMMLPRPCGLSASLSLSGSGRIWSRPLRLRTPTYDIHIHSFDHTHMFEFQLFVSTIRLARG